MNLGFSKYGQIFQLSSDDYSRYAWVDFLSTKGQTLESIIKL